MSGFLAQIMQPCSALESRNQQRVLADTALWFPPLPPYPQHHPVHPKGSASQPPPDTASFLLTSPFPGPITTFTLVSCHVPGVERGWEMLLQGPRAFPESLILGA